jgi:hypothetical protein
MNDSMDDWPVDQAADGAPVPPVGSYVTARRVSDGKRITGVIDDNRAGVFITGPAGRHALTARLWDFTVHSEAATIPASDQVDREELFFTVLTYPELLDGLHEAA